jgi:hypothetical protein
MYAIEIQAIHPQRTPVPLSKNMGPESVNLYCTAKLRGIVLISGSEVVGPACRAICEIKD